MIRDRLHSNENIKNFFLHFSLKLKVANLLDEASLSQKDSVRLTNLKHVQELILRKNAELLDNFLDVC